MMVRCYLVSEGDKYELPIGVFRTQTEVARFLGMHKRAICIAVRDKRIRLRSGVEVEAVPWDTSWDEEE